MSQTTSFYFCCLINPAQVWRFNKSETAGFGSRPGELYPRIGHECSAVKAMQQPSFLIARGRVGTLPKNSLDHFVAEAAGRKGPPTFFVIEWAPLCSPDGLAKRGPQKEDCTANHGCDVNLQGAPWASAFCPSKKQPCKPCGLRSVLEPAQTRSNQGHCYTKQ